jgi:hypothetical protein
MELRFHAEAALAPLIKNDNGDDDRALTIFWSFA